MNTDTYFAMYNYLVFDRRFDVDEAQCTLTDVEVIMEEENIADPWEVLEELV